MCDNCHRHQIKSSEFDVLNIDPDWLTFTTCLLTDTGARTKFRTIPRRGAAGNNANRELCLCSQCYNYLTLSDDELKKVTSLVVWPSFLWFALKNESIQDVYGDIMWRFIPNNMRRWWLESIDIFHCFSEITIRNPKSYFLDITYDNEDMMTNIRSGNFRKVATACNKYLLPTVLFPWGCSDYIHKSGLFEFDFAIQRFLLKVEIKPMMTSNRKKPYRHDFIVSARDDYIRLLVDDYDRILLNKKWLVRPCLIVDGEKGLSIMT